MDKVDLLIGVAAVVVILHGIQTVMTQEVSVRIGKRDAIDSETETFTGGMAVALGIVEIAGAAVGAFLYLRG